jgi:signal transduction histidine kinase
MNRPWKVWLAFGLCAFVVFAAMAWISLTALRLDQAQFQAQQQADLEERVRLALWRMDSELSPLMVEESARPWSAYEAFAATERAFTKAGANYSQAKQGDVLVPSPLLAFASSNVLLHFQLTASGQVSSPQVPQGEQRALAETSYTTPAQVAAASARLEAVRRLLAERAPVESQGPQSATVAPISSAEKPARAKLNGDLLLAETSQTQNAGAPEPPQQFLALNNDLRQAEQVQRYRNTAEFASRANVYNRAQQQTVEGNWLVNAPAQAAAQPPATSALAQTPAPGAGIFRPFWLGQTLLLARRVDVGGSFAVQGVWLNWQHLRASLLDSVKDLLPDARLEPVLADNDTHEARRLAALPARLVPGRLPASAAQDWTPVQFSLALAWVCVLLATAAVASLLHGTLSLSERRAAFVSAVTHELRTPLTTFRMYSEMLAEEMVPDPARRKGYLQTLVAEAGRLSHLVENVLAYARLERGSARSRVERVTLAELIQRVRPRLEERATQAGLRLAEDVDEGTTSTLVRVDVSAVEQILFNLVDNACKYAAPDASERVIHLEALPEQGKFALLRVRDHGQGISAAGMRRLFQPFSKSAHEAAHSAPGVGLGLALSRRLSRSLGGDLRLDSPPGGGAAFVLSLPLSAA